MVHVLQWNAKSLRPKKHEILNLINKYHPSIIAISETWLVPGSRFRISGYSCVRDDRIDGYAGSALFIRRYLPFFQVSLPSVSPDINIVAIRAFNITFLSVYIPRPHSGLIPDLICVISSIPSPIFMMGDFNAHHSSWGSNRDDLFGLSILEMVDDHNLCIMNSGSPTRRAFPHQNPNSAVDLTICSASLASVLSWNILTHTFGSDHFPIIINISDRVNPSQNFCPSFKYRLVDDKWPSFSSSLENKLDDLPLVNSQNLLDCYAKFVEIIISSADENFPIKKPTKFIVSSPWWDPECTAVIRDRKMAEDMYNNNMSIENFLNYRQKAARARKLLCEKKKKGWIRFCENLSPRTPSSLVWNQIKRFRGSCSIADTSVNDPSSWLEGFSDKLCSPFVPNFNNFPSIPQPLPSQNSFDCLFSFSELQLALDGLVDSSPGIDGIPYSFLKNMSTKSKEYLLILVNFFFEFGCVPEQWKTQVVVPILKPGKDPSDPNSYRPIALSSVLCKVTEHMVKHRLEWLVENRNLLPKSQFGFRKGMSTMDSLSILTTDIRSSFLRKEYLVGVFLDIASAYDNVLLPVLRNKLIYQLNIPEKLVRFICNLFMQRTISIKSRDSILSPRTIWKGLPQGSVLSPILYNLYTCDLEHSVISFCEILQYADDLVLYTFDKNLTETIKRLSSALGYLSDWLFQHGLSLSASKSSVVVFSKKRFIPRVDLIVDNECIPQENSVKFLGVWLDSRLSGVKHTDYVAQKCERNINVLRALSGVWWGAHPFSQKLLYNAIVRSHLDYGLFPLDPCNKSGLQKLDKIQSKCLRIILGAMKSSPINAMQVECVDPPLSIRRQYLANRFFFKLVQNSNHPLLHKLYQLSCLIDPCRLRSDIDIPCLIRAYLQFSRLPNPFYQVSCLPLYLTPYEALIFQPNVILDFKINRNTIEANRVFASKINSEFYNWRYFFTDASKLTDDSPVGAAVWIPYSKIILSFKCPPVSSVFTGETVAIFEAVAFIKAHNLSNSIIFSDSKSCLQTILSNPFRSKSRFPLILKIRHYLYQCHQLGINVVLAWIPGHCGIPGNETADSCAKNAINTGSLLHHTSYSFDICSTLKSHLLKSWNRMWQMSKTVKGKFYGDIQPEIPNKPWFFKFQLSNKSSSSTICRLRLNHSCTPVFLAKLRVKDSSLCECGLDEGNVDHIFFNCPLMRFSLYDVIPSFIPRPISFKHLLPFAFSRFVYILCKYIRLNKIKL